MVNNNALEENTRARLDQCVTCDTDHKRLMKKNQQKQQQQKVMC